MPRLHFIVGRGSVWRRPEAVTIARAGRCVSIPQRAVARAEIVIEGEILPGKRVAEDQNTGTGEAMPEFLGYTGEANPSLPVINGGTDGRGDRVEPGAPGN